MNRFQLLGGLTFAGLTFACLTLTAGAALAQTAPMHGAEHSPDHSAGRSHVRADADSDGRVSRTEFVNARIAPLVAMDADQDGTIGAAERTAARQSRVAAANARRFERLDTDKDGQISPTEFGQSPRSHRGVRVRRSAENRPGLRSFGHRQRGPDARRGRDPQPIVISEARVRAEARFERLDRDKDGYLVQAERQAARMAPREVRRARRHEVRRPGGQNADRQSPSPAISD